MPETANASETVSGDASRSHGRVVASASNAWVEIEALDKDIWQIGQIKLTAAVRLNDLEAMPRQELQRAIKTSFTTPIPIFSDAPPISDWFPPVQPWLKRTFSLELVPSALDEQLLREDVERFGQTDADVRSLIDKLVEVFVHNLGACTRQKRRFQATTGSIYCFVTGVLVALLVGLALTVPKLWMAGGICLLMLAAQLGLQQVFLSSFRKRNEDLYTEQYIIALQTSANKVSHYVGRRMTWLSKCFEEAVGKIDNLFRSGEKVESNDNEHDDGSYKNGQAFLLQQILMWLPARVEGLERHTRIKMREAEFEYARADYAGYRRTWSVFWKSIWICGVIALAGVIVFSLGLGYLARWAATCNLVAATTIIMAAVAGQFVCRIAQLSYRNQAWNPPRRLLKDFMDVDQWDVARKFNAYIRIPARLQKAVITIARMDELRRPQH